MAIYMIGYDLNSPGQDYSDLREAIRSLADGFWHHLDSTWLIGHPGPASVIRDALLKHIDKNDELLVAKLTGESAWYGFDEGGSEWLRKHM